MGISRKDALSRLESLVPQVVNHLRKIAEKPDSTSVPHWGHEVRNWLSQMEDVLHAVGKKTAAEWRERIDAWREGLDG